MLTKIRSIIVGNGVLRTELIHGAVASLIIKMLSMLVGLMLAVILARNLGPEGYGIYSYVFSLVTLIAIPSQLGIPVLLVRETAKSQVNSEWGVMLGLWYWSTLTVSIIAALLVMGALLLVFLFIEHFSSTQFLVSIFGIILVPIIALGNLPGAALRGLRHVIMGQLPEFVLRPGILILLLLAVMFLSPENLSPSRAMGLHVVAAVFSFAIGAFMLWSVRPVELASAPKPEYKICIWIASVLPITMVTGMQLINQNTDIIMLGLFRSADEVGIYKVAVTGSSLVAFGLQAITLSLLPHFTRLYTQGDTHQLQKLIKLSARGVLMFSLPVVLLFVFLGDEILYRVFGEQYVSGSQPLAILSAGQFVCAIFGSVVSLLMMTGHERDTVRGFIIAAFVNIILNWILIPMYGMNGAAIATTIALAIWNIILWKSVRNLLGIESMAFNFFPITAKK